MGQVIRGWDEGVAQVWMTMLSFQTCLHSCMLSILLCYRLNRLAYKMIMVKQWKNTGWLISNVNFVLWVVHQSEGPHVIVCLGKRLNPGLPLPWWAGWRHAWQRVSVRECKTGVKSALSGRSPLKLHVRSILPCCTINQVFASTDEPRPDSSADLHSRLRLWCRRFPTHHPREFNSHLCRWAPRLLRVLNSKVLHQNLFFCPPTSLAHNMIKGARSSIYKIQPITVKCWHWDAWHITDLGPKTTLVFFIDSFSGFKTFFTLRRWTSGTLDR